MVIRLSVLMILRRVLVLMMLASVTLTGLPSLAQVPDVRTFPPNTKRGVLNMDNYPDVIVDGKLKYTVPATRFYDDQNMLILPTYVTGNYLIINYTENEFNELQKIWILTADERRQVLPKPEVWTPMEFKSKNQ
ncbi:hypothetical protein [Undibacterium sp. TJN19]|uniref:hypothetical protein n=1 Tax=Undibacterium sp. TJN19 TaxID=3413055 RepID=UPI003BF0E485